MPSIHFPNNPIGQSVTRCKQSKIFKIESVVQVNITAAQSPASSAFWDSGASSASHVILEREELQSLVVVAEGGDAKQ